MASRLSTVTDAEGNKTTYGYDGLDRLAVTYFPSTTKGAGTSSTTDYEQLTYDAGGNVTSRRLRDGNSIAFTYDALNRVTNKNLPNLATYEFDIGYSYDLLGRMTQALDSNTHYINLSWDVLGRMTGETSNFYSRTSTYDLAGRRTRLTHGDDFHVDYDYLVTGEMAHVRENGATSGVGVLATYAYDDLGRRTSLTRGNGTSTSYSYDAVSRLSQLVEDLSGTTYDQTLGFTYSPTSQIVTNTRSNDAYAWGGHYNVTKSYTANGLNQYTVAGSASPTYDSRGNLTSAGSTTFAYTSENRLASYGSTLLAYDPLGRLHYYPGASLAWMYDGDQLLAELNTANLSQIVRRYVYGPDVDEPIVWYEGSGTTDRRFLHTDERGSVVAVTNSSGSVIGVNSYDEYGVPASGNIGRFQYTGQVWMADVGLYYYKARMYSSGLGRFLQADPIGYESGMNLYGYVGGDPINWTDPLGLKKKSSTNTKPPKSDSGPGGTGSRLAGGCYTCTMISLGGHWEQVGNPSAPGQDDGSGGIMITAAYIWVQDLLPIRFNLDRIFRPSFDRLIEVGREGICLALTTIPGNRIRAGADAAGGVLGVITAGFGVSVDDHGNIMFDKYGGIGKGVAAIFGAGVAFDNGAARPGTSYDRPQVAQVGLGKYGFGFTKNRDNNDYGLMGGIFTGAKYGGELASMDDFGTETIPLGSVGC